MGADIESVCREAVMIALRENFDVERYRNETLRGSSEEGKAHHYGEYCSVLRKDRGTVQGRSEAHRNSWLYRLQVRI